TRTPLPGKEPVPADRFDDDCDPPYIDGKRFPKVVEDPVSQTVSASAPPAAPGAPGSSQVPARSTGSRTRFRQIWRSSWRALAFVAVMIVAWWLVTSRGWVQPYILSTPCDTFGSIVEASQSILKTMWITIYDITQEINYTT